MPAFVDVAQHRNHQATIVCLEGAVRLVTELELSGLSLTQLYRQQRDKQ